METTVGDVVGLGSTVTVRDEFGESTYVIVGPVEADVAAGRISMVSPLGAALMGRTVADEVSFAPRGHAKRDHRRGALNTALGPLLGWFGVRPFARPGRHHHHRGD